MKRSTTKLILWALTAGFTLLLVLIWYIYTKDYSQYFLNRRGTLSHSSLQQFNSDFLHDEFWVFLQNPEGLAVTCGMLVPRAKGVRLPAVILLGGKKTGKHAIDYANDIHNAVLIAPDYPYVPRQSYTFLQFVGDIPTMRQALLDMVPSVLLVTDYLSQRDDVDTTKIVILGYSFGAPLVPAIVAHDRRPAVAVMAYSGGDLRSLIRHNVTRYEGPLVGECVGLLGALLLRPLEPMRYIEQIAPIPFIMINGAQDEQIPRENAEMLYNGAGQPKKIIWLESKHVHPRNVELTQVIIKTLKEELARLMIVDSAAVR